MDNIICGKNAVLEYLMSGKPVDTLYVLKGSNESGKHIMLAKQAGGVVKDADAAKLKTLSDSDRHGGIVLVIPEIEYANLDELLGVSAEKGTAPFIIIADEITDPHNLGALIRTAEAAGADGVVIPKRRSVAVNATVHSTSAGAASHIKICREANLADVINKLKKHNIWVYGAEMNGQPFRKQDYKGGVCLVIGSEGSGLRRLTRESCDIIIGVDMYGKINSLNASVCGGILMYEVIRQRKVLITKAGGKR
jgi:23S rRNA (guanosine2251-2'-O)-methyltransferase